MTGLKAMAQIVRSPAPKLQEEAIWSKDFIE